MVFRREQLLADVWGYADGAGPRTVDSHVRALRRKLGEEVVRTVHGVGYGLGGAVMRPPARPVGSIKLKLGIAIVVAVGVSSVVSFVGFRMGCRSGCGR